MSLLFNSRPLVVDKDLANILGLNEALVLQQIHYWLEINRQADKNRFDGRWWTYNSVAEWQEQFPFFSFDTVKRTLKNLRDKGLLITGNFNRRKMDRTLWYTIDYSLLEKKEQEYFDLHTEREEAEKTEETEVKKPVNGVGTQKGILPQCKGAFCPNAKGQSAPMQKGNLPSALPESNTEITTEIPSIYPALDKSEGTEPMDGMGYAETEDMVRELISADYLKEEYDPDEIEELVLLITDTLCSSKSKIRVGREWKPKEVVHSRLLKLNETHIACVLDSRRETSTKINNIHAYLLTALYNAPTCSSHKVAADVEFDCK